MIEQAMQLKKRYEKMVNGFREEDFKGWFVEFFNLYPFIERIQWTQYTPYFNDGEPCEFGVNDPELQLSAAYIDLNPGLSVGTPDWGTAPSDDREEDEAIDSQWLSTYSVDKSHREQWPQLYEAVSSLKALFEAQDILQHVFGEHSFVTVTPEKIVVDEYQHD
jgi:hypothetical protein